LTAFLVVEEDLFVDADVIEQLCKSVFDFEFLLEELEHIHAGVFPFLNHLLQFFGLSLELEQVEMGLRTQVVRLALDLVDLGDDLLFDLLHRLYF
jgi:hypothetical protein